MLTLEAIIAQANQLWGQSGIQIELSGSQCVLRDARSSNQSVVFDVTRADRELSLDAFSSKVLAPQLAVLRDRLNQKA